ncbi:ParA family protein [Nitrosophilus kaiyonis]|uniref:ParA family protein n=1 Tax=Nitrosophilus kaiyonis TaxID=2930200 RepID=UPI002492555D|nr:ParA family protein [Nitrosophilus kaiyonis]
MKKYKIAILNTKGGVGKSTVSMQLIVPYLYEKTQVPISYFEFDDENEDAISFDKSKLIWLEKVNVSGTDLREQLRDILLLDNSICMDVGANKTTVFVLNALIDSGMIHALDLVVIPLMDGELDAVSAINIYHHIKKANPDIKTLFVLNRWNENREIESQFDLFLGDKYGFFDTKGVINYIDEKDRNYIVLADSDAIKYSRGFGITLWELANKEENIDEELKKAIMEGASKDYIRMLSFKKALKKDCEIYRDKILKKAFEKLDNIL